MAAPDWVVPPEHTAGGADVPRHDANDLSLRVVRVTAVIQVVLFSALILLSSYWRVATYRQTVLFAWYRRSPKLAAIQV